LTGKSQRAERAPFSASTDIVRFPSACDGAIDTRHITGIRIALRPNCVKSKGTTQNWRVSESSFRPESSQVIQ